MMNDVNEQVYSGMFVGLPAPVKNEIIAAFGLQKNGMTHVVDGRIQSDGYLDSELAKLNVESISKYLNSDSRNLFDLWNALISRVTQDLLPKQEEQPSAIDVPNVELDVMVNGETVKLTGSTEKPRKQHKSLLTK